jgi:hypothetical protein
MPPRPKLAVLLDLLVLQHAECLTWEVVAVNVFGVKNVAEFVAAETIEARIVRIQFSAEMRAVFVIPMLGP